MRLLFSVAATIVLMAAPIPSAWGQFSNTNMGNRGTATTGMFGATTIGGSSALSAGGSRNSASNAGIGAGGMGSSGLGMVGASGGGMGAGGTTMQGVPILQQSAFVGAANGGNPRSLMGQGGQGMNGMQGTNGLQGFGGSTLGGRGGLGGLTNLRNSFSQQGRQNSFNNQQAQRGRQGTGGQQQIRVPIRLGFAPPPVAAPQFSANLTNRLAKTTAIQAAGDISVSLEGRTAILRGTVATEADRRLAESLARLEPEVSAVQNELVVSSAGTTAEELPPAAAQ
jgi:hypothetical protein